MERGFGGIEINWYDFLWLHDTKITPAAVAELQKALPDCFIFHESLEQAKVIAKPKPGVQEK